jgi:hypothetical protein
MSDQVQEISIVVNTKVGQVVNEDQGPQDILEESRNTTEVELTKVTPLPKPENAEGTPKTQEETASPQKASEEKKKEKSTEEKKKEKASTNAWGAAKYGEIDANDKHFGLVGMFKFTWPRLWRGTNWMKFVVVLNFIVIFFLKLTAVFIPLLLKEVIDAITCDDNKFTKEAFDKDATDKFLIRPGNKCPSH